ncbi:Saposin B domain-containing protein [Heracleum sosnowskyi]|uniref:Pulmonary surfactant-associated protein B n=1 Tax=Heracleum sosnowskyi TaxID=360622 RepID=A0AAD8IEA0_9APIA|nr:Saposin B domain-containing protein [Heracleum sosnowskyi]
MGMRLGFVVLIMLGTSLVCHSRDLGILNPFAGKTLSVSQAKYLASEWETKASKDVGKKENVCTLCEEFATDAQNYLSANKTQKEIVDMLQKSCSKLHSFNQECLTLVEYYVPLFFMEISSIEPEDFCQKVNLCEEVAFISQHLKKDSCEFCQKTVAEALLKLKDPETELELVKMLLKVCNSVKGYEKQCKKMVFEYGPVILMNAEHLLESNDVCTMLHACESPTSNTKQATSEETIMLASS